jgi:hypothetical protein
MLKTEMKMKTDPDVEISQLYAVPKNWKLQLSIPTSRFSRLGHLENSIRNVILLEASEASQPGT